MTSAIMIRLTAMGDVLLAIPAARALAARHERVHWVLHERWADLAEFLPAQTHLVGSARDLLPLARRLRHEHPDALAVYDLQGKPLSHLLCLLLGGADARYEKRTLAETWKAWRGDFPLQPLNPAPVWKRYLTTVQADNSALPQPELIFTDDYLKDCRRFLREIAPDLPTSFVAFHPGASHAGKRFTSEHQAHVLRLLDTPLLLIGDQMDLALPRYTGTIIDARGRIPLRLLPGLLRLSQGLITSDSGPMHLARAAGTPLVACFFQTDPCLGFAPVPGGRQLIVSRSLPCKPCSLHGQRSVCPRGTWDCRRIDWQEERDNIRRTLELP